MATRMAEPITVRGRPSLEDTLARWLTEDPRLLEQELIEGSLGRTANPRLEALLQGGKGSLLRKLLRIPEAEKQLFSFEQLKDILRDARKVPSLGEGQRALDAGFTGESKGQTVFDFPSPKAGRETLVDVPDALLSEASPPNMVGPDIVPAPGPKLYPKVRAVKGNLGLALVQDKLFGGKAWSESSKQARDALGEAIEEVQDFNSQGRLKAFLQKRYNLSPDQVDGLVAELGLPKGGVETVRGRAAAKLYELGQVHGSHFMAGTGGDDPKIAMRLTDEIRNRTGGMSHKDVARRAGQDVLTGMTEDEANQFIKAEQKRAARAEDPMRFPKIRRELTEQFEDFPETNTQRQVREMLGKFEQAREKVTMKPTELGAKPDGPTMAKWLKDKNAAKAAYAAIDVEAGQSMALSNKLVAAIQERYPEITAQQLDTVMPRAMKKVFQGIANNRELTSAHEVKPWELRRFSKDGHLLIGETEVPLALAIADANARHSEVENLKASGMRHGRATDDVKPPGAGKDLTGVAGSATSRPLPTKKAKWVDPDATLDERTPPFKQGELEDARQNARAAKRGPFVGPVREGDALGELNRARLVKNPSSKPTAEAFPLDAGVKKVLDEIEVLRRIKLSAADTDSAYAAALAQAKAQGKPLPTKQAVRSQLTEKKDVDLSSDFKFGENNEAARIENATYRKAQKAAERELPRMGGKTPRQSAGIQLAALLRDGEKGLPASGPKEFEKIAKLAKDRIAAFKDLDLASIKKILRGKGLAGASPQVQQSWKDVQRLTMRRDAHETGQLKKMVMGVIRDEPLAMPRAMKKVPIDVDQVAAKLGPEATTEMLTQALQGAEAEASAVASKTAARVAQAKRLQSILKMLITKL